MIEKTLIILKPDCIIKKLVGQVIHRINQINNYKIIAIKMMYMTDEMLNEHYKHLSSKSFFNDIKKFMKSTPLIFIVLQGENVIQSIRKLLGPTDSNIAPKGTLRGDFGENAMENIAHASDNKINAEKEIKMFFNSKEIF